MTDYIKFWVAKELAALGIIVAIVLLIVGVAAFTLLSNPTEEVTE